LAIDWRKLMQIDYDEQDDILLITFNSDPIIKDISLNWHVNIGFTEQGIGEISILEAGSDQIRMPMKEKNYNVE